jgi:phospholipid/cholesterol/gamma-HCH transport system permease protein
MEAEGVRADSLQHHLVGTGTSSGHPEGAVRIEIDEQTSGHVRLALRGRLDAQSAGACWRYLQHRLGRLRVSTLDVDASGLELRGGIGVTLLYYLSEGGMTPLAKVSLTGLKDNAERLLKVLSTEDFHAGLEPLTVKRGMALRAGSATREFLGELYEQICFVGSVVRALPGALARPKQMRWSEVGRVIETAGANALPLVGIVCWLMGLVMTMESVRPLQRFGAESLVSHMIGFASVRDVGPIVTGIMLASRSGSAFAAELATMKVTQELDALVTMGLSPVRFLVVQRMVAALILTPLLSFYGMLLSILGGVQVMQFMGFPLRLSLNQVFGGIVINDIGVGLTKSVLFGVIVGAVGCYRGLQTKEGPQAVGESTTRSVVSSVLLVIVTNTIHSTATYVLNRLP